MEAGAIVGIVLGAVALLLIVAFLVYGYWWKPYHHKTAHTDETNWDHYWKNRRKFMETYGLSGEVDGAGATMSVNENDFNLQIRDNPYTF